MNSRPTGYVSRLLNCPKHSYFLFGSHGVGKSTMLREFLPDALQLALLDASLYLELSRDPHRLESIIGYRPMGAWIVLDEVHRLRKSRRWRFALCASSAHKLLRGGANLLAGRAVTANLEGLNTKPDNSEIVHRGFVREAGGYGSALFRETDERRRRDLLWRN